MTTVLHLIPGLERVGAELDTVQLAGAGVAAGQTVLVAAAPGPLAADLAAAGIEHLPWTVGRRSPASLRWIGAIRELCRRRRIDLIHAHSRLPAWWAWLAWRSLPRAIRPRLVTTVHGCNHVSPYSGIMLHGDLAIAVSSFVADHLRRSYPLTDGGRITVIPRGIDPERFPAGFRAPADWEARFAQAFPIPAGALRLGLLGRVVRGKGHSDLLRIVAGLRDRGIVAQAICIGERDPRHPRVAADLDRLATTLGIGGQVTWTGPRTDVCECLAHCDFVMSLSRRPESFGLAALEAASLGRPVIAYDLGGVGDVLRPLQPTGLVAVGDIDGAIARILAWRRGHTWPTDRPHTLTRARTAAATWAAYARVLDAPGRHP